MGLPHRIILQLRDSMDRNEIIGFSPWRDADGLLFGRIVSLDSKQFTVIDIDPLGQSKGECTYSFNKVSYFHFATKYSNRLERLASFKSTFPHELVWVATAKQKRALLEEALQKKWIARLRFIEDSFSQSARVLSLEGDWCELQMLDEYGIETDRDWRRVSAIAKILRWCASTEADNWLALQSDR